MANSFENFNLNDAQSVLERAAQSTSYSIPTELPGQPLNANESTTYNAGSSLVAEYQNLQNSVVRIQNVTGQGANGQASGDVGSGLILTANGEVATDLHVVDNPGTLTVKVGQVSYPATVEVKDPQDDLALVKIDASGTFKPAQLGSSADLKSGDPLIAMGYPMGLNQLYMSPGGYSFAPGGFTSRQPISEVLGNLKGGLMKGENPSRMMLQSDMNVDNGQSGGPLVNDKGEVVGLVDISNDGTKAESTPVEDLIQLLNRTKQINSDNFSVALRSIAQSPSSSSLTGSGASLNRFSFMVDRSA